MLQLIDLSDIYRLLFIGPVNYFMPITCKIKRARLLKRMFLPDLFINPNIGRDVISIVLCNP